MQTPDKPNQGTDYTYDEVASFYQHDASQLHWVIVKGRQIVALRLREDYNREIFGSRAEVWVGNDSPTKEWGSTLANDTATVPIYVKKLDRDKYTYLGIYEIMSDDTTESNCVAASKQVDHGRGVSRIVFLKKS